MGEFDTTESIYRFSGYVHVDLDITKARALVSLTLERLDLISFLLLQLPLMTSQIYQQPRA